MANSRKRGKITTRIMRERRTIWNTINLGHIALFSCILAGLLMIHGQKLEYDQQRMLVEANLSLRQAMPSGETITVYLE